MKVRILGCGTSTGVPRLGNDWGDCDPTEPKNERLRSSILVEIAGKSMLVDCGPDLRQQLLAADVVDLDRVIVTHDHADHCHGIDELRVVMQAKRKPVPLHARNDVVERLTQRFAYAFADVAIYRQILTPVAIEGDWQLGEGASVRFVDQPHGGITSLGLRFEEDGYAAGYAIDFNEMTDEMKALYEGVDLFVCDCLGHKPHPTHAHLEAVVGWARELQVGELLLTHMGTGMDFTTLASHLPDWAAPAFDGQEVEFE